MVDLIQYSYYKQWIILVCLLFTFTIQGVKADQTENAVIAASIVAGLLFLILILVVVIIVVRSHSRRSAKKPVQNGHLARMDTYPVTTHKSLRLDVPRVHGSPKGKAYTQHAATPRQRPPVQFYTMGAIPKGPQPLTLNQPDLIPIGPQYPYRAPPPVGRPVIFLDWSGMGVGRADGRHFMHPNGGNMFYYADGPQITEVQNTDENKESRHRSRESRHRKRAKPHSKSRSQSEDKAGEDSGHHSHNETTDGSHAFETPRNFILTTKDIDIGYTRKEEDDINNNNSNEKSDSDTVEHFLLERMMEAEKSAPKEQDFIVGAGPFSVTQMRSSYHGHQNITVQEKEQVTSLDITEQNDEEVKEEEKMEERPPLLQLNSLTEDTPRADYTLNQKVETSGIHGIQVVAETVIGEKTPDPTPRVDYGDAPTRDLLPDDMPLPTPRIDYLNESLNKEAQSDVSASRDLDEIIAMGVSSRESRSQTQIETGEIERESVRSRSRSPPLGSSFFQSKFSMSSTREEPASTQNDFSAMERLDNLAKIPPPPSPPPLPIPPPLPSTNVLKEKKYRPPTPPPGKIIKKDGGLDIDDIILLGQSVPSTSKTEGVKELSNQKKLIESQSKESSGLPFMEELRRRQRSIDGDLGPFTPPSTQTTPSLISRLETTSSRYQRESVDVEDKLGISSNANRRTSIVQFAQDPPEIIPEADYLDSPTTPNAQSLRDSFKDADQLPAIPIPPPPPPPPPPLSAAGIPVLY